jgi:thiamine biosynthesis lipoprotein
MTGRREGPDGYETLCMKAMNTSFYFAVKGCRRRNWKKIITGWVRYVEREWSRFGMGNELNRLNQLKIGEKIKLSPPLLAVLQQAEDYRKKTNGLFSPYLLPQMIYHGYDESFPFSARDKTAAVKPHLYQEDENPFEIDLSTSSVIRKLDGQVDLGGIGKGYTVQAAARWLQQEGHCPSGIADGGGDMTVWSTDEKRWNIGIADPFDHQKEIARFNLKNGSIATSNLIFRSWKQGGVIKHHLLNGQTGMPVESNIVQATVISSSCLEAEVAAKLMFMEKGTNINKLLCNTSPHIRYLLVTKEGKLIKGGLGV